MSPFIKLAIAFVSGYWVCSVGGLVAAIHIIGHLFTGLG